MSSKRKHKILDVTPAMAERWLNANTHNRPLRNGHVATLAAAMKAGEWRLTAEPVAFSRPYRDASGKDCPETLINGQHRLFAIVESGVTIPMTVWWGCEPEEFEVIDTGRQRTFGDVLSTTRGDVSDHTLVASVCSSAAHFAFGHSSHSTEGNLRQSHINCILSALRPEIESVVGYKKKLRQMAPRPVLSALLLVRTINPGMADSIADQLKEAIGFTEHDPIRALHLYLTNLRLATARDSQDVTHYKVCHALAARLRGDRLKHLRITGEGLGWLRDACRDRISPIVVNIHGKTPHNFYSPKLLLDEGVAA